MNNRRTFLSMLTLGTMLLATSSFAATMGDAKAKVGEAAPNFTLADANGKDHSLKDYEGKIVVLQWINPDCPVCRRVSGSGLMASMHKQVKALDSDVVFLAINSTNYMEAEKSASYLKKHKLELPALIDQDGTVGKMYGARTTPHVYVIDTKGVLRYQGEFDNDPSGNQDDATNYVVNTVTLITEGDTVTPDSVKPYGCSVKYKKK